MKIAFIRANSFGYEPRLIKYLDVIKHRHNTSLILWEREKTQKSNHNYTFSLRLRFGDTLKMLVYLPLWHVHCIKCLIKIGPEVIFATNIDSILPAFIYSKLTGTRLVYDIWDTGIGMWTFNSRILKSILKNSEKFFMYNADAVIVPDTERFYQLGIKNIKKNWHVIYNSNLRPKSNKTYNFKNNKRIKMIYCGTLVKNDRGLEMIIENIKRNNKYELVLAGYGKDEEFFKKKSKSLYNNIHFKGKIGYRESLSLIQKSDIVVSLLNPKHPNYKYATSTKVFDAFSLSKPVITTKKTATGSLVEECNWGAVIDYNQQAFSKALKGIENGDITFNLNVNKVDKYSPEKMEKELNSIISDF